MQSNKALILSGLLTVVFVAPFVRAETNVELARKLAENNDALKRYSWTTRVEITEKDQKVIGLYKMRYDIDDNLQITPMSSDAPPPEDIATGVRELARLAISYAQPGLYEFQRFLSSAEVWEGRGALASTARIEGENLHVAGDSVKITTKDGKPRLLEADTSLEGQPFRMTADYRDLPQNGPTNVARVIVNVPGQVLEIRMESFDYQTDAPVPVAKVTVPQGTELLVRTTRPMSTKQQTSGETFDVIIDKGIVVEGREVVPKGTRAVGRLVDVQRSGRASGRARMSFVLTAVYLEEGPLAIQTELISVEAQPTTDRDVGRIAGTTVMGTIIGGIAGGGKGAARGAAIGAGAGAGATLLTRGDEVEFPAEQLFTFRLAVPVAVRSER